MLLRLCCCIQKDLEYLEASEDQDEEFYAGGGQYRRRGLEHFPQLWCDPGAYSLYGQVCRMQAGVACQSKHSMHVDLPACHQAASALLR